jgi:hypothetical protein
MNQNLKKLHNKKTLWKKLHNQRKCGNQREEMHCVSFFCINDTQPMNLDHPQLMR